MPRFKLGRNTYFFLGIPLGIGFAVVLANFIPSEKHLDGKIEPSYAVDDPQFLRSMGTLLGPPLVGGNTMTAYVNGDEIFPAMLDGIRSAQRTVTFETFIYWSGKIGAEFADALTERARAGVKVRILLDFVGSTKMDHAALQELRDAGCEVVKFHPLRWFDLGRFNNRTHRKLLVIDGKVGFTGGVGIGDEWSGNAQDPQHWRDCHFRIVGPAVAQIQAAFMANWIKAHSTVEHTEAYFPEIEPAGNQLAQMFHSSPEEGSENIRLMYLLSIAAARHSILLEQAYFVPDKLATEMLAAAARRGVRVEVIAPGPLTDTKLVRRASRSLWGPLLEAGVRIFEYQPTNFHCKIMIVDGRWSSVGSTNFDNRSFRLNDEANLNIYDQQFAGHLEQIFEADKTHALEVSLKEWKERPWHLKVWEAFWKLFHSQM